MFFFHVMVCAAALSAADLQQPQQPQTGPCDTTKTTAPKKHARRSTVRKVASHKPVAPTVGASAVHYRHGENPDYALKMGWPEPALLGHAPAKGPTRLPGSLLP